MQTEELVFDPFVEFPEIGVIHPKGSFEVDGIMYTPPWKLSAEDEYESVHYQPMFDLKADSFCGEMGDECDCWWSKPRYRV